jgi:hypothetical protein
VPLRLPLLRMIVALFPIVKPAESVTTPLVKFNVLSTVAAVLTVAPPEVLLIVRMLNVVPLLPPMVCAELPSRSTVPVPAVNVPELNVQLLPTSNVPPFVMSTVPPENVAVPLTFNVPPFVIDAVPPEKVALPLPPDAVVTFNVEPLRKVSVPPELIVRVPAVSVDAVPPEVATVTEFWTTTVSPAWGVVSPPEPEPVLVQIDADSQFPVALLVKVYPDGLSLTSRDSMEG